MHVKTVKHTTINDHIDETDNHHAISTADGISGQAMTVTLQKESEPQPKHHQSAKYCVRLFRNDPMRSDQRSHHGQHQQQRRRWTTRGSCPAPAAASRSRHWTVLGNCPVLAAAAPERIHQGALGGQAKRVTLKKALGAFHVTTPANRAPPADATPAKSKSCELPQRQVTLESPWGASQVQHKGSDSAKEEKDDKDMHIDDQDENDDPPKEHAWPTWEKITTQQISLLKTEVRVKTCIEYLTSQMSNKTCEHAKKYSCVYARTARTDKA